MMSANPRYRVLRNEKRVHYDWTDQQVIKVRAHCDKINPTLPGGCKCSFPKCDISSCRKEIKDALR